MSRQGTSLAIRADGDARLGYGHVMRCAALAQALLDTSHRVVWFSRTPDIVPAQLAARIDIRPISAGDDEATLLIPGLAAAGVSGLIGDWQTTEPRLCAQLRRAGVWLALIGNHTGVAKADLYIRQRFGPAGPDSAATVCDGSEHLLLAPGFAGLPARMIQPRAKRLLITLGGSETAVLDCVLAAFEGLSELEGTTIDIKRTSPLATDLPETGLLDELRAADIAVLGAGTTLHEAAATGLAAIALPIAANQFERAQQFEALGLGLSLDPAAEGFAPRLRQQLTEMLGRPARRAQYSRAGQSAVDGRGAERVARRIASLIARAQTELNANISRTTAGPAP